MSREGEHEGSTGGISSLVLESDPKSLEDTNAVEIPGRTGMVQMPRIMPHSFDFSMVFPRESFNLSMSRNFIKYVYCNR